MEIKRRSWKAAHNCKPYVYRIVFLFYHTVVNTGSHELLAGQYFAYIMSLCSPCGHVEGKG